MDLIARKLLPAAMLALLANSAAFAQIADEIPHASYFASMQAFYEGGYRTAERELRRESARGIHTTQARWIDSICYYAMLGEVLYHEGRNADALAQFDQACQILLAYPDWLLQVRFQAESGPRVDLNRTRRVPPWGRSQRTFVLGLFPATEQVLVGDLNAENVIRQGGVYRAPMLWRVHVSEVVRMSALAIRRRNELLGPLASQDPITQQLSTVLARGNLAPTNHWSRAWIDLLRGLAQIGAGRLDEADMLLGRSLVIEGQYDHPLTGVALLEQGRIAMLRGDTRRATQLLAEAGFSAYYFEDWDVLTESVLNGWINHMGSGGRGVYPPLEPVATWAQTNRLQHVGTKLRLAQAESVIWLGDLATGTNLVEDAGRRIGEMRAGLPGIHLLYLQAVVQIFQGHLELGGETLTRALAAQSGASLRNFQILRTNSTYDAGITSPRSAIDFYTALLADPSPADWLRSPLDAMAVVETMHDAAFDRWFLAALDRKDVPLALEISERTKRRRYLAAQPFGGRLLALSTILEAPDANLSRDALSQRQQILAAAPQYRALAEAGQKIYTQLRTTPVLPANAAETKSLGALYDQWDRNASQRQQMLGQLVVRRLPSSLEFPPIRTTAELQNSLQVGEALIVFHCVGENLYRFTVQKSNLYFGQLPDLRRMRTGLTSFLHALGNYGANRDLSIAELKSDAWHKTAKEAYEAIFNTNNGKGNINIGHPEVGGPSCLVIVPDNLLWYLPFEALVPNEAKGKTEKSLGDLAPICYAPTAALAVSNSRPMRRVQHTGILAGDLKFAGAEPEREKVLQGLVGSVTGPVIVPEILPQPARLVTPLFDGEIVLSDLPADAIVDSASLLPRARSAGKDKANAWTALPYGGPERIVLTGFKTEAEQGLKASRRDTSRSTRPSTVRQGGAGDEIFQSVCNLMASGARTILLTRWRTGGQTNFDLVREFAKESANAPAAEAWQRACFLARENPIDQNHEPRLKHSDETGDMNKADHPFFWAGYLLIDTGPRPVRPRLANPAADKTLNLKDLPGPAKPEKPLNNGNDVPAPNPGAKPRADDAPATLKAGSAAPPQNGPDKPDVAK